MVHDTTFKYNRMKKKFTKNLLNVTLSLLINKGNIMLYINEELCKGCFICVESCPRETYTISETLNHKGVHIPIPDNDKCIKCGLCVISCPDQVISLEDDD